MGENKILSRKLNTKSPVDVGIDLGSTTAKLVVIKGGEVVYHCYERHFAKVRRARNGEGGGASLCTGGFCHG